MEVSSVQHLTKWHKRHEAGSSVSCFYMLLSEDAVVFFFPPVYNICYCTASLYLNSIRKKCPTSDAAQRNTKR